MAGDWSYLTLKDAGVVLFDCDHRTPEEAATGYPYVTIPQMRNGEIDLNSARTISSSDFAEWTKKTRPQEHDVLLSRRCNPGETAVVRSATEFAVGQNLVLLRADGRIIRPAFLRWLVRGPLWWEQVEKYRNPGAVFDSLKCRDIVRFELSVPPLDVQERITAILSSLDDKIELNRRMAATLEEMARALFKSWFMDFDPVRAKASGRPTGLPDATAALFPARFGEDGLPEGWQLIPIGDVFDIRNGNTPSTEDLRYWGGEHHWATPKDLSPLSSPVLLRTDRKLSDQGVAVVNSGLLPPGSVLISTRAPIGYLAFATHPVAINQGMAGIVGKELSTAVAWLWCDANVDTFLAVAGGSTFPEISKGTLRKLLMVVPTADVSEAFATCVDPIVERLVELARESDHLATLRDALLPRLISGELRIGDGAAQGVAA